MVGLVTGKALAHAANKPLIAVNHLEGHALTARLTDDTPFPYLLLLVSGAQLGDLELRDELLVDALEVAHKDTESASDGENRHDHGPDADGRDHDQDDDDRR
jgi:hypothetical protein